MCTLRGSIVQMHVDSSACVCVCVFWMCVQTGDIIRELDNVFRISSSLRLFNFFGGGGDINCDHTNPNFGSV